MNAAEGYPVEAAFTVSKPKFHKEGMLTEKIHTIEEHQNIVGSRFQLAQIVMHRTRELLKGSQIKDLGIAKVGSEFNPKRKSEIPPHRFPKIALEELRLGKLTWRQGEVKSTPEIDDNPVVFGE